MQGRVQDGAESTADSTSPGASDSLAASLPSGKRSGRDRHGRFSKGNRAALKHGRFSAAVARALLPEQREVLHQFAEHESALIGDLGGDCDLSTFELDMVRRYQQLHAIAEFNAARMLSTRAAQRREARDAFMAAIDRQLKIVALLGGPRRRQKDALDLSAAEYAAQQTVNPDERDPDHPPIADRDE